MKKNLHIIIISTIFSVVIWVSISLSNEYFTTIRLPINIINVPSGYGVASQLPEHINIRVKGRGWKLFGLNFSGEEEYLVSVEKNTGKFTIKLSNSISENTWLGSDIQLIDFSPSTIELLIEKHITTKVKVMPSFEYEFKTGYGLASPVKIVPDSVLITGAESLVKNLKSVLTSHILFKGLEEKTSEYIPLTIERQLKSNFTNVRVDLDVQRIVDKEFYSVEINVLGLPPDRDVVLLPDKVDISLRGGIDYLSKLNNDDINLFVNYSEILSDTIGSIAPLFTIPNQTELLYLKPNRIRYIIKKY